MATWHKGADPLLNSNIPALAGIVSRHTHTCAPGENLGAAMAAAVAATTGPDGAGGSRVSTLIVPHDLSWERAHPAGDAAAQAPEPSKASGELAPGAAKFVREAAAALRACPRGKAAIYLGGRAGLAEGALLRCVKLLNRCWAARQPVTLGHRAPAASSSPPTLCSHEQAARWRAVAALPAPPVLR